MVPTEILRWTIGSCPSPLAEHILEQSKLTILETEKKAEVPTLLLAKIKKVSHYSLLIEQKRWCHILQSKIRLISC